MANYAQTVNVLGCIKTSKTAAAWSHGPGVELYRANFGVVRSPPRPAPARRGRRLDCRPQGPDHRDRQPHHEALELPLDLRGHAARQRRRWQIAGNNAMAFNEPGKKPGVAIERSPVENLHGTLSVAPLQRHALPARRAVEGVEKDFTTKAHATRRFLIRWRG